MDDRSAEHRGLARVARGVVRRARAAPAKFRAGSRMWLWRQAQALGDPSAVQYVPPGHFYSPIASLDDVRSRDESIFAIPESIPGIDLRAEQQMELVRTLAALYRDQPFSDEPVIGMRYHFQNDFFNVGDGLMLHLMLRHLRPARIIEVGSGYSTALIQDTIARFGLDTQHAAIDPYPAVARRLLEGSVSTVSIEPLPVQDVALARFDVLGPGDVLFIDSTHVSKVGSDVNRLVFDVLPRLRSGVIVHIHDMFYPFEYPRQWVYEGRAWNEAYVMRAFLTDNPNYRILLFNNWLAHFRREAVADLMPLWQRNTGCSLWLERM